MSKSLGNFLTIHDLLADWPGEVLRLTMMKTHYRQPIDWTVKSLEESWKTLDDWYWFAGEAAGSTPSKAVVEALSDDLNTPKAIAELHGLRNAAQRVGGEGARDALAGSLRFLGFLADTPADWAARRKASVTVDAAKVEALIAARLEARAAKNWAESDRIRDELTAMGLVVKDAKDPTTGEMKTTWEVAR
jgi:cysteinyl-tRNA synthetase